MSNDTNIEYQNGPRRGKVLAGIILLAVGASLLLKQFDFFFFPGWLFSWPTFIIIWGLYIGANHNFRNSTWLIMVIIGTAFLLDDALPGFDISAVFWPLAIITFGIWLIIKRNNQSHDNWDKKAWKKKWDYSKYDFNTPGPKEPIVDYTSTNATTDNAANPITSEPSPTGDDFLDAVSVFGGVKKIVFSKKFQGGEIVNVFGGAEIDLTQADIHGTVTIELTQIFGGTKIIVPSHWMVISDMAAVFAGFDDKRIKTGTPQDKNKILILKGTSVFGGTDIRSY